MNRKARMYSANESVMALRRDVDAVGYSAIARSSRLM